MQLSLLIPAKGARPGPQSSVPTPACGSCG
jgi:hypothetical protein